MPTDPAQSPPYRREAATHAANLGLLLALALVGLWDHRVWLLAAPIEAAVLWVVPDLPPFRKVVEDRHRERLRVAERARYLDELWALNPPAPVPPLQRWLLERDPVDPDDRIVERGSPEYAAYVEMREIVAGLGELVGVRGVRLTPVEVARCEDVVTGYLRLLVACRPLERALAGVDVVVLDRQLAGLDRQLAEAADGDLRVALAERRQILAHQRARAPRLEATLQLFRTRAGAMVQQLRNLHAQVLTDPGIELTSVLDTLLDQQEALTDPLGSAAADQLVDDFVRRSAGQRNAPASRSSA